MKNLFKLIGIGMTFILSLYISSLILNHSFSAERLVELEASTLPRVAFEVAGQRVNHLFGYVDEMNIPAMRDTITPVEENGNLRMFIEPFDREITEVIYEVYSLDGNTRFFEQTANINHYETTLQLSTALEANREATGDREAVLLVTVTEHERPVRFYTRIRKATGLSIDQTLGFAMDFHAKTFDFEAAVELRPRLEPTADADNATFQTVDLHSRLDNIRWGEFQPTIVGEVEWGIKECNASYTSILATYQIQASGVTGDSTYNIREFFRVREVDGRIFLLNYHRTMNQVLTGNAPYISKEGIVLGIAEEAVEYKSNTEGTVISFVQERELWSFRAEDSSLIKLFGFANHANNDIRSRNDQHSIRILRVKEDGSTVFAVFGYMNRGLHEGRVGVQFFFYDASRNVVDEIAFVPSNQSYAMTLHDFGRWAYYSHEFGLLYILTRGTIYQIDVQGGEQNALIQDLVEGQYVASEQGHKLAWQTNGSLTKATEIMVKNLENGKEILIHAPSGESIQPLGFVGEDFVAGFSRTQDAGQTVLGDAIHPMYRLVIFDENGKEVMTYQQDNIFITDVLVFDRFMTLNRVSLVQGAYTGIAQDTITSNEPITNPNISIGTFMAAPYGRQVRINITEGILNLYPQVLRPRLVRMDYPIDIAFDDALRQNQFYVYARGMLMGIYNHATYAIQSADELAGVVISSDQAYVWERGNRFLNYDTRFEAFVMEAGQSARQVLEDKMTSTGATRIDLTGSTLNQVLYVIQRGLPVIAVINPNEAVLITAYTTGTVTYMDPATGQFTTVGMSVMDARMQEGGNVFVGFLQ